jgi:uncharacterized membrane-anchored protein
MRTFIYTSGVLGMKPVISVVAAAVSIVLFSPPLRADQAPQPSPEALEAQRQIQALHWIHGPKHVELYNNAALDIPAGYMFLNPADTAKLESLTHNIGGANQYFLAPEDFHWEAFFDYRDDGYVKDDQKIDADAILDNIKKGTAEANKQRHEKGWDELEVTGWQTTPHYDPETKHLEWAIKGRDLTNNVSLVNFNTRILGRGGVTSVVLLSDPERLDASIDEFKTTLSQFSYLPGQKYAEYKPGDKLAQYGLAALITGGAAAIAIKTGFWKVLLTGLIASWKFIVAGAVALFGGISRFFKRKST